MSDTVLVALITFASGFAGVLVGAVANYKISKLGVQAEKGKLLHDEKRDAYSEMMAAYYDAIDYFAGVDAGMCKLGEEPFSDVTKRFFSAYSTAVLVAPESVQHALAVACSDFERMMKAGKCEGDSEPFNVLSAAMRKDLMAFSSGAE